MNEFSRIYIAGHTGLIGSAILRALTGSGYKNLVLATHQELELTNRHSVFEFFLAHKPEYVILAAGRVGGIIENRSYPADFITTNIAIQQNVIDAAHYYDVNKLVYFGSSWRDGMFYGCKKGI